MTVRRRIAATAGALALATAGVFASTGTAAADVNNQRWVTQWSDGFFYALGPGNPAFTQDHPYGYNAGDSSYVGPINFGTNTDYCLSVSGGGDGSPVWTDTCNDWPTLHWFETAQDDGSWTFSTAANYCLDATDGTNGKPGVTRVQIWTCTPQDDNQRWFIGPDGELQNKATRLCLDDSYGNVGAYSRVVEWYCP